MNYRQTHTKANLIKGISRKYTKAIKINEGKKQQKMKRGTNFRRVIRRFERQGFQTIPTPLLLKFIIKQESCNDKM